MRERALHSIQLLTITFLRRGRGRGGGGGGGEERGREGEALCECGGDGEGGAFGVFLEDLAHRFRVGLLELQPH